MGSFRQLMIPLEECSMIGENLFASFLLEDL